jgi:hypothetical protein
MCYNDGIIIALSLPNVKRGKTIEESMKNKNIKLLFCALLALLLMIGVASCKHSKVEAVETVAFTDALGREVNAPKNPKRVAALLGSFAANPKNSRCSFRGTPGASVMI